MFVAAAARYFRMNADNDWERTIFLPDGSSKEFELADWAIPLSLAAGLSTRHVDIGIGSTVKFAYNTFGDETLDATAVDLGAIARKKITPWEDAELSLALGASAINMGSGPAYNGRESDLPYEYRVGIGIGLAGYRENAPGPVALWRVNLNVEFVDTESNGDFSGGVEFGVLDTAFLRVGQRGDELSLEGGYWGFGLSTRFGAFAVSADYAQTSSSGAFWDEKPHCFGLSGSYRY
jgi:hypothetical protein